MALKKLLVALTTTRAVDGEERRVRFAAGKVVDLTESEMEMLDTLQKKTGKLHYREPIHEGKVQADEPEVVELPDYEGQDIAIDKKTVDQLKAYLTFHSVSFGADDNKPDLLKAAKTHEAGGDAGDAGAGGDPDSGL